MEMIASFPTIILVNYPMLGWLVVENSEEREARGKKRRFLDSWATQTRVRASERGGLFSSLLLSGQQMEGEEGGGGNRFA